MVDTANIIVKSGDGGDGIATFERAKYVPKGGPNGGDGGKGGNVIFKVAANLNTLNLYKSKKTHTAASGESGKSGNRTGADGEDLIIFVPVGTQIFKIQETSGQLQMLHDLNTLDSDYILAKGGKPGIGNVHFKSATNQTPLQFTKGEKTEPIEIRLELKVLADIGLIGLPSSGKTSLLNTITNSQGKTAEYHFTTLEPNLGILYFNKYLKTPNIETLSIADIPGLIEGAYLGKGLGQDFLRHIERTKLLVHLISLSDANENIDILIKNYKTIRNELSTWNKKLDDKKEIIAVSKVDLVSDLSALELIKNEFKTKLGLDTYFISNYSLEGIVELVQTIHDEYLKESLKPIKLAKPQLQKKIYKIGDLKNKRIIYRKIHETFLKK